MRLWVLLCLSLYRQGTYILICYLRECSLVLVVLLRMSLPSSILVIHSHQVSRSSTMVTAVLPAMTAQRKTLSEEIDDTPTLEPVPSSSTTSTRSGTSQIAGLVGMFTGCGALVALGVFLPLPTCFQNSGSTPADAIQRSYYTVGGIALAVAVICFVGLTNLAGEENKGWRSLFGKHTTSTRSRLNHNKLPSYWRLLASALKFGFTDIEIGLGYLGGFVARASSVGISLFIPLYVNAYFISSGLCKDTPGKAPSDIKEQCKRAYTVAAMLTGVSQLVALICAPLFGILDGKFGRYNAPLLISSLAGVIGYVLFARVKNPDPKNGGSGSIFAIVALLGISQIGAIVCSLSMLGRGIEKPISKDSIGEVANNADGEAEDEDAPLIESASATRSQQDHSRRHLKGSIAGIYSLAGGAGILLLTKLGGALFDKWSPGAPFYMLAIFNGVLLVVVAGCGVLEQVNKLRQD